MAYLFDMFIISNSAFFDVPPKIPPKIVLPWILGYFNLGILMGVLKKNIIYAALKSIKYFTYRIVCLLDFNSITALYMIF